MVRGTRRARLKRESDANMPPWPVPPRSCPDSQDSRAASDPWVNSHRANDTYGNACATRMAWSHASPNDELRESHRAQSPYHFVSSREGANHVNESGTREGVLGAKRSAACARRCFSPELAANVERFIWCFARRRSISGAWPSQGNQDVMLARSHFTQQMLVYGESNPLPRITNLLRRRRHSASARRAFISSFLKCRHQISAVEIPVAVPIAFLPHRVVFHVVLVLTRRKDLDQVRRIELTIPVCVSYDEWTC